MEKYLPESTEVDETQKISITSRLSFFQEAPRAITILLASGKYLNGDEILSHYQTDRIEEEASKEIVLPAACVSAATKDLTYKLVVVMQPPGNYLEKSWVRSPGSTGAASALGHSAGICYFRWSNDTWYKITGNDFAPKKVEASEVYTVATKDALVNSSWYHVYSRD